MTAIVQLLAATVSIFSIIIYTLVRRTQAARGAARQKDEAQSKIARVMTNEKLFKDMFYIVLLLNTCFNIACVFVEVMVQYDDRYYTALVSCSIFIESILYALQF